MEKRCWKLNSARQNKGYNSVKFGFLSSTDLKVDDLVEVRFGNKLLTVKVLEMKDSTKKEDAAKMYEIVSETRIEEDA